MMHFNKTIEQLKKYELIIKKKKIYNTITTTIYNIRKGYPKGLKERTTYKRQKKEFFFYIFF